MPSRSTQVLDVLDACDTPVTPSEIAARLGWPGPFGTIDAIEALWTLEEAGLARRQDAAPGRAAYRRTRRAPCRARRKAAARAA